MFFIPTNNKQILPTRENNQLASLTHLSCKIKEFLLIKYEEKFTDGQLTNNSFTTF